MKKVVRVITSSRTYMGSFNNEVTEVMLVDTALSPWWRLGHQPLKRTCKYCIIRCLFSCGTNTWFFSKFSPCVDCMWESYNLNSVFIVWSYSNRQSKFTLQSFKNKQTKTAPKKQLSSFTTQLQVAGQLQPAFVNRILLKWKESSSRAIFKAIPFILKVILKIFLLPLSLVIKMS